MRKFKVLLSSILMTCIFLYGCSSDFLNSDEPLFKQQHEEIVDALYIAVENPLLSSQLIHGYSSNDLTDPNYMIGYNGFDGGFKANDIINETTVQIEAVSNVYKSGYSDFSAKFCGINISYKEKISDNIGKASFLLVLTDGTFNGLKVPKGYTDTSMPLEEVVWFVDNIKNMLATEGDKSKFKVDCHTESLDLEYLNKLFSEKTETYNDNVTVSTNTTTAKMDDKTTQTTAKTTKPKTTTTKAETKAYVEAYAETALIKGAEGSEVHVYAEGDFEYIELQILSDYDSPDSRIRTYYKSEINDYIILGFNAIANPPAYLKITPYNSNDKAGESVYYDIPTDVSSDYVSGGNSNNTIIEVTKYGTIYSKYGNKIDGLSKSFLIDGGAAAYERHDLTHGWHIKAVNEYYDGSSYWYELYDADDGDYYGWVHEANISFY